MSDMIRDPENIKQDIKFKLKSSKEAFYIDKKNFVFVERNGKPKEMSFKEFLDKAHDLYLNGRYDLAAYNSLTLLQNLPGHLKDNAEKLDENLQYFISTLADYYSTVDYLNREVKELKTTIQEKEQQIDELRNSLEQERENSKNKEVEKMNENMNNMVNVIKEVVNKPSTPTQSEVKTEEAQYNEVTRNSDTEKKIHNEVVEMLSISDMTPIHKYEDLDELKKEYINYWKEIAKTYDYDTEAYPELIDRLEDYANYSEETTDIEGYKLQ